jgi:hypothetical protein
MEDQEKNCETQEDSRGSSSEHRISNQRKIGNLKFIRTDGGLVLVAELFVHILRITKREEVKEKRAVQ